MVSSSMNGERVRGVRGYKTVCFYKKRDRHAARCITHQSGTEVPDIFNIMHEKIIVEKMVK